MTHLLVLFLLLAGLSPSLAAAERVLYLVPDRQGSPVAALDAQGAVVWREAYGPWGRRTTASAANSAAVAYTGKPEDSGSGLVYMGARWYDPESGRFTGVDPQEFAEANVQSFNRYAYGNNSPYVYVDPDGELPVVVPLALAYTAYRAWSAADTLSSGMENVQVLADGSASTMDRVLAGAELAGSVVGGKAGRQAVGMAGERVANSAYQVAKEGGKHAGFLRNYAGRSADEISNGISSIERRIAEHRDWIANPEKHIPGFRQLDPRQQAALINKKWPSDIQRQSEQLDILKGLLNDR